MSENAIKHPTKDVLEAACCALRAGGLVVFPTETVYGLGADATNDKAVAQIFEVKGRPTFNPLIIHFSDAKSADAYVVWNDIAEQLAAKFWPGPLTFVLPRREGSAVSLLASAGLDTLAVRCPEHPIARELIALAGVPVAAPSANASGKLSPTHASHVQDSLGDKVDLIIDGGPCRIGLESTVLDLSGDVPTILRHGGVTQEQLSSLLGEVRCALSDDQAPKSPGMLASHYAPHLPVRLNVLESFEGEAFLTFGSEAGATGGATRLNLSPSGNGVEAAANLFAMLRQLDQPSFTGIAVMPIPSVGLGAAINDRLRRAAAR